MPAHQWCSGWGDQAFEVGFVAVESAVGEVRSGHRTALRFTLQTFVQVLEVLHAQSDLSTVLVLRSTSLEIMRRKSEIATRQRAYTKRDISK